MDHLWQKLMETDQASEEFPRLAIEILDAQRSKFHVVHQFAEEDVPQLIDLIDRKVLQHKIIPTQLKGTAFGFLRRLCGTFQQLPSSCLIDGELMIDGGIPCSNRAYADLRKGSWRGENVAIKLLRTFKDDNKAEITKRFCKEIVLWKQLRHKNILPFYGACMGNQLGMVSPWLENGNIIGFTRKNPEANRLNLLIDVSNGLEYLHHSGVIHGNLRSVNILIDSDHRPRLAEFGLARIIEDSEDSSGDTPWPGDEEGTLRWSAPECLHPERFGFGDKSRKRLPSKSTDVYALGMTVLEVVTRRRPFDHITDYAIHMYILDGKRPERPRGVFSGALWELLHQSWNREYESTPSMRPPISLIQAQLEKEAETWDPSPEAITTDGPCIPSSRRGTGESEIYTL
ncbi:kinase-like domain-containing protein [Thelephora terrestris]|uniref:Kinase-like domain-containing protein n=1 Tax=Thelephora terrestris TaxID=56493 RepID=A0A9P6H993_9AGAM|nr:kinase-like domain-containing protein [Thelephora terrestris]